MAIIIGYHRQSARSFQAPYLASWHRAYPERVDEFLKLPIVIRIIGWVNDIVETVFPGVAARFRADAKWHKDKYGIEPHCGLFWNLCLNTWFRGQKHIHCHPHADKKNQIGICILLIYVLESGKNFNHGQRTWIVIWEGVVIVELPPWTLAIYPSSLFYHFNVDVDVHTDPSSEIQFVTTEGHARPTRQNSKPIIAGDDEGRGSFVFFNQSTMRQGPVTGFDTIAQAKANGHSGVVDYGTDMQAAFERNLTLKPIVPTHLHTPRADADSSRP
ncbi:hypothetical protein B0H14DRAFT_2620894 [Mycena olivaceomarginata]|nr:hypothetical protein B0H14DRAFT_2620894 [Mycena olivaceomarginata]